MKEIRQNVYKTDRAHATILAWIRVTGIARCLTIDAKEIGRARTCVTTGTIVFTYSSIEAGRLRLTGYEV